MAPFQGCPDRSNKQNTIRAQQAKPQGHSGATAQHRRCEPLSPPLSPPSSTPLSPPPLTCGELKADPGQSIWCPHTCLLRHLLGLGAGGGGRLALVPSTEARSDSFAYSTGPRAGSSSSDRACRCFEDHSSAESRVLTQRAAARCSASAGRHGGTVPTDRTAWCRRLGGQCLAIEKAVATAPDRVLQTPWKAGRSRLPTTQTGSPTAVR